MRVSHFLQYLPSLSANERGAQPEVPSTQGSFYCWGHSDRKIFVLGHLWVVASRDSVCNILVKHFLLGSVERLGWLLHSSPIKLLEDSDFTEQFASLRSTNQNKRQKAKKCFGTTNADRQTGRQAEWALFAWSSSICLVFHHDPHSLAHWTSQILNQGEENRS